MKTSVEVLPLLEHASVHECHLRQGATPVGARLRTRMKTSVKVLPLLEHASVQT